MWEWCRSNPSGVQALTGILSLLVAIIVGFVTIIYVRTNWRVMKMMEADLLFRTKPLPNLRITTSALPTRAFKYDVELTTANAPLRLISLEYSFQQGGTSKHVTKAIALVKMRVLRLGENYSSSEEIQCVDPVESWSATLVYADMAGLATYRLKMNNFEPFLTTEEVIPNQGSPMTQI